MTIRPKPLWRIGSHTALLQIAAEIGDRHLGKALVAQDAGVVDENVDMPPCVEHRADHRLDRGLVGDRCRVCQRRSAAILHFLRDAFGGVCRYIVDQYFRAFARKVECVGSAQASARTRDYCGFPIKHRRSSHVSIRSRDSE
jgi:hypothetical protein